MAAIRDHVKPRGAGDDLPASPAGAILAIADRADSVVGCYLADKGPSGGEDPYGVRRAGNTRFAALEFEADVRDHRPAE